MAELKERLCSCQRALATLDEAVDMPFSVIVRDAAIQPFEYSFESLWKLLKTYLVKHEGTLQLAQALFSPGTPGGIAFLGRD